MAIPYQRKKSITIGAGFAPVDACADDDGIYVLVYKSTQPTAMSILTFSADGGSPTAAVSVNRNTPYIVGFDRLATGWTYATWQVIGAVWNVNATGRASAYTLAITPSSISTLNSVTNLLYVSGSYRLFYTTRFGSRVSPRVGRLQSNGSVSGATSLPSSFGTTSAGIAFGDDRYFQMKTATDRNLVTLNASFRAVTETNTLSNIASGTAVKALAHKGNELIAITDTEMYFYQTSEPPEPPTPPTPAPAPTPPMGSTQQLILPSQFYQRFDLVTPADSTPTTGGNITTVKATNFEMIHTTEASTIQLIRNEPFVRDISEEHFISKFTIPNAAINDYIMLNKTGNVTPTAVTFPAWKINRISDIGDSQRQVFIHENVIT